MLRTQKEKETDMRQDVLTYLDNITILVALGAVPSNYDPSPMLCSIFGIDQQTANEHIKQWLQNRQQEKIA